MKTNMIKIAFAQKEHVLSKRNGLQHNQRQYISKVVETEYLQIKVYKSR